MKLQALLFFLPFIIACSTHSGQSDEFGTEDSTAVVAPNEKNLSGKADDDELKLEAPELTMLERIRRIPLQEDFLESFEGTNEDSGIVLNEIEQIPGKKQALVITRKSSGGMIEIRLFQRTETSLLPVLVHGEWDMTYMDDTLYDVDGDEYKDFVVNGYGSNGCCLKAYSEVYLKQKDGAYYSRAIHFLNPTFSPKDHLIRGICYGQPGETEMYKYRWKGDTIQEVEYISYEMIEGGAHTGKILITDQRPYGEYKVLKKLDDVPNEYKNIWGYDWFTGEGY